ncbi:MAG: DNA replication and repair protein RecF [Candidatus Peribacteraceae bacterium]|nr:DNA replication and repair protein RecF [Candidatus Peribacteraceae bacterium]
MRLASLLLEQFRCYTTQQLEFSDGGLDLFIGPNGSGKTNILESVSILSTGKSCIQSETEPIIQWGKEYYRVKGQTISDTNEQNMVEVFASIKPRKQKAFFINDVRTPVIRFIGSLPSIVFLPSHLQLFVGGPAGRRDFLDDLLSQLSPDFLRLQSEYQRVLKQRNSLLRLIADNQAKEPDLDPWDSQIAQLGSLIAKQRIGIIENLNASLGPTLIFLGEKWGSVEIRYDTKHVEGKTGEAALLSLLQHYRQRDIILKSTTVGPHRDDWHLFADNRDIALFASRGQQRASLLSLLFVSLTLFSAHRNEKPIILLDDVFSELDDAHQRHLLSAVEGYHVLLTGTHLPSQIPRGATVWEVENGRIEKR